MPYAKTVEMPRVGDRVRHLSGRVGTVIFVQREAPASQAREHIRVRWDEDLAEVAPFLANEYTLLPARERKERSVSAVASRQSGPPLKG